MTEQAGQEQEPTPPTPLRTYKEAEAEARKELEAAGRERIVFKPHLWSLQDDEDFETATGLTVQEAFMPRVVHDGSGQAMRDNRNRPVKRTDLKAAVVAAIIWIEKRHADDSFSYEDAKAMTKNTFFLDLDDESDDGSDPKDADTGGSA